MLFKTQTAALGKFDLIVSTAANVSLCKDTWNKKTFMYLLQISNLTIQDAGVMVM